MMRHPWSAPYPECADQHSCAKCGRLPGDEAHQPSHDLFVPEVRYRFPLLRAHVEHPWRFARSHAWAFTRFLRRRGPFRRELRMCRWRCMYVGPEEVCPRDGYCTTQIWPDGWARVLWGHFRCR